jgi:oligopeptide/dipeptide ABC transporter ATP-binding protein
MSGRAEGRHLPGASPVEASGAPLLEARDLRKAFATGPADLWGRRRDLLHAVDGVDLRIEEGEIHGLVGESGCGKSTLGRLVLGLIEADSGSVSFNGRDIAELAREAPMVLRSGMQIVFQNPFASLNPRLSIGSTLREVLRVKLRASSRAKGFEGGSDSRDIDGRVGAALAEVGLSGEVLGRYPRELSGGQLQRIGIARALLVEPRLLVADEPLSALDLSVQAQIINLLSDLRAKRRLSILLISHDLRAVRHIADSISVMYLGRIVECGPADEVLGSPAHPYTRALMAAAPDPQRALGAAPARVRERELATALDGEPPNPVHMPSGCRFAPRCGFCMPRCRAEEPSLLATERGRACACWLNLR